MSFKEWLGFFFKDKRFGWRFKIANFVMRDSLRNYLAVGVSLPLENAKKYYDVDKELAETKINRAIDTVNELFEM